MDYLYGYFKYMYRYVILVFEYVFLSMINSISVNFGWLLIKEENLVIYMKCICDKIYYMLSFGFLVV